MLHPKTKSVPVGLRDAAALTSAPDPEEGPAVRRSKPATAPARRVRDEKQRAYSDDVGRVHESGNRGDVNAHVSVSGADTGTGTGTAKASNGGPEEQGGE